MRLEAVGKRYGARQPWVVRGVSADLRAGRLIRVSGRNGSGKSTLLRVVAGVSLPSTGKVTGRPHTGYVPERFPGGLPFSGREYLVHLARVHGLRGRQRAAAGRGVARAPRRRRLRGPVTGVHVQGHAPEDGHRAGPAARPRPARARRGLDRPRPGGAGGTRRRRHRARRRRGHGAVRRPRPGPAGRARGRALELRRGRCRHGPGRPGARARSRAPARTLAPRRSRRWNGSPSGWRRPTRRA